MTRSKKLTRTEQRLLRFPPTRSTWLCNKKHVRQTDNGVERSECGTLNSGSQNICWMCGTLKPKKPKLLWPAYLVACEKAGIEPGQHWKPSPPVAASAKKRVRRKGNG